MQKPRFGGIDAEVVAIVHKTFKSGLSFIKQFSINDNNWDEICIHLIKLQQSEKKPPPKRFVATTKMQLLIFTCREVCQKQTKISQLYFLITAFLAINYPKVGIA